MNRIYSLKFLAFSSFFIFYIILLTIPAINAVELAFPESKDEIRKALNTGGKINLQGITYLWEKGQIYKIINGNRLKVRGINAIVEAEITPRFGGKIKVEPDKPTLITRQSEKLLKKISDELINLPHESVVQISIFMPVNNNSNNLLKSIEKAIENQLELYGIHNDRFFISSKKIKGAELVELGKNFILIELMRVN